MSSAISYYFDIDRRSSGFILNADYHIDGVYDPWGGYHSQTQWEYEYRTSQGVVIDSSSGYAGETASVQDGFGFDTGPGVAVRQLEFTAANTYDDYGFYFYWNVFDGAKETANLTFGGTNDTDILFGGSGNDTIRGYGDDDWLDGGAGIDQLIGGLGDDTYVVDNAGDLVLEASNGGNDTVRSSVSFVLPNYVETLDLIGSAAINATGNALNNTLAGNDAANVLTGNAGADRLIGEGGADRLIGGSGADTFTFRALSDSGVASSSRDLIYDFNHAQGDRIDLHLIDANTGVAGNQAFDFIGSAAFSGHAGELRAVYANGRTTVSGDVDGNGTSDFAISLRGHISLTAGDFIL